MLLGKPLQLNSRPRWCAGQRVLTSIRVALAKATGPPPRADLQHQHLGPQNPASFRFSWVWQLPACYQNTQVTMEMPTDMIVQTHAGEESQLVIGAGSASSNNLVLCRVSTAGTRGIDADDAGVARIQIRAQPSAALQQSFAPASPVRHRRGRVRLKTQSLITRRCRHLKVNCPRSCSSLRKRRTNLASSF